MKILAVADIHGREKKLTNIQNTVTETKADVLVIAGDIINYFNPAPVIKTLAEVPIPVLVIRGNSDPSRVDKLINRYSGIESLHLKKILVNQTAFTGINGTIPFPFHSRIGFREKAILLKLRSIINKSSVLVVHPPPRKTLDKVMGKFHAGSKGLRNLISEKQPQLVICGHIHEDQGHEFIGSSLVVNCSIGKSGNGVLIEINGTNNISTIDL